MILSRNHEYEVLGKIVELSVEVDCEVAAIKKQGLTLISVYRSPVGNFNNFMNIIENVLNFVNINDDLAIAGDFNVCSNINSNNVLDRNAEVLLEVFQSYGLKQTIYEPTRNNNCIDNIFVRYSGSSSFFPKILTVEFSDHKAQCINIPRPLALTNYITKNRYRPLTQVGFCMMHNILSEQDWSFIYDDSLSPNDCFDAFHNRFIEIFLESFPEVDLKTRTSDSGVKWFSGNMVAMREKVRLYNDMYNHFRTDDIKMVRNKVRSEYRKALRMARMSANDNFILKSNNPGKNMWKIINRKRHPEAIPSIPISSQDFNSYFISLPHELVDNLPKTGITEPKNFTDTNYQYKNGFRFQEVSFNNVRDAICSLKGSKSRDYYGLSISLLKRNINHIVRPLTRMVNRCIEEGVFPDCLKVAKVIPIHKKGDKNDKKNYRPISLLPIFSKVFEKIIHNQVMNHFESENLLYKNQFGFRKKSRTCDAILRFVEYTLDCFEKGLLSLSIFLDLSRAFDCVSPQALLDKLAKYGFDEISLRLIMSYFTDRKQKVFCNGTWSAEGLLSLGVPQGSILGPLLFIIFMNDFSYFMAMYEHLLWADDSGITVGHRELHGVEQLARVAELRAKEWFVSNMLVCNAEKTETMLFNLRGISNHTTSESVRFLGVYLDPSLTWISHANEIASKIIKNTFLLRNLANIVSKDVIKVAYHSLVESHLRYCVLIWGNCSSREGIFRLQRRAVRIVAGLNYRDDCVDAFKKLKILTFPSIYIYECLVYAYNNNRDLPKFGDTHDYYTRYRNNIKSKYMRLEKSKNGPNFISHKLFNKIPEEVKRLSLKKYKQTVGEFLRQHAFWSVQEFLSSSLNFNLF